MKSSNVSRKQCKKVVSVLVHYGKTIGLDWTNRDVIMVERDVKRQNFSEALL